MSLGAKKVGQTRKPGECLATLCVAAYLALAAPAAFALETDPPPAGAGSNFAEKVRFAYWQDRSCKTPACNAARPAGLADIASFGIAALGGVLLSRRHPS